MKFTALALALSFGLISSMAAFAQTPTPAAPATPAQTQAQTKPAAKADCSKAENKAKAECKVEKKAIDKKS
jgi:ribosomal protein L12E/L44/L45/RPP1/RPP2